MDDHDPDLGPVISFETVETPSPGPNAFQTSIRSLLRKVMGFAGDVAPVAFILGWFASLVALFLFPKVVLFVWAGLFAVGALKLWTIWKDEPIGMAVVAALAAGSVFLILLGLGIVPFPVI